MNKELEQLKAFAAIYQVASETIPLAEEGYEEICTALKLIQSIAKVQVQHSKRSGDRASNEAMNLARP